MLFFGHNFKPFTKTTRIFAAVYFFSVVLLGCNSTARLKRQEDLDKKIAQFNTLLGDIKSENLQKGMPSRTVREIYGEPTEIFSSGSSTGKFEIWSYDKIITKSSRTWAQIRLYFSDDKIISWSY